MSEWKLAQQNRICFVMVDSNGVEVAGLGGIGINLEISKNGSAFISGTGAKTEIANGWYSYLSTAEEANSVGVVAIKVTGAGAVQQNLEYSVQQRNSNAIVFTYTVTDVTTGNPIEGVEVIITTDSFGSNVIWAGNTDTLGVARDDNSRLPYLDPGTYFFWSQRSGFSFNNPDTELVN